MFWVGSRVRGFRLNLVGLGFRVAEWIHFTLPGITLPTIELKVYTSWGLMNSATKKSFRVSGFRV